MAAIRITMPNRHGVEVSVNSMNSDADVQTDFSEYRTSAEMTLEKERFDEIDEMLSALPDNVKINQAIANSFERMEPLTVEKFHSVADEYKLPKPHFHDDNTIHTRVMTTNKVG